MTNTLFEEISSLDNLREAWINLNKSNLLSCGNSGTTILDYKNDIGNILNKISTDLKSGSYVFSPSKAAIIPKDNYARNKKYRPLQISEIDDRIVMKSISIALESELETELNKGQNVSFAYQKGVGPKDAIQKMVEEYNKGNQIILKADIQNFFNEIIVDDLLESKIFPALRDKSINELIKESLNQKVLGIDRFKKKAQRELFNQSEDGIPQGNPISPLLSNIYLASFDAYMKSKYTIIRYADDFIVLCKSKAEAIKVYNDSSQFLINNLSLRIHDLNAPNEKTKIIDPIKNELTFLSVSFNGRNIYPKKRNIVILKKKLRKFFWLNKKNEEIIDVLLKYLSFWVSKYTYTKIEKYYKEIDDFIDQQLIKVLFFQGKIKREASKYRLNQNDRDKFNILSMEEITNQRRIKQNGYSSKFAHDV